MNKYMKILLAIVVVVGLFNIFKPIPPGTNIKGEKFFVPNESVTFLKDMTYLLGDERVSDQEIFDEAFSMIQNAQHFILVDMFLFNDFQGQSREETRLLSSELTELLINKKKSNPDIKIIVVSDRINNVYGGSFSKQFIELRENNVPVVITDVSKLRDSNPLYSSVWRTFFKWFGNSDKGGILPNPFQYEGDDVTIRTYLHLLNFKANHRKLIVADEPYMDGFKMTTLVTSGNPHDGSSAHSNVALKVDDALWRDVIITEQAVVDFSGEDEKLFFDESKLTTEEGDVAVQLLTERAIRDTLVELIDKTEEGDSIDMLMFYLSERNVVRALKRAIKRGVAIRLALDPNKDAFGHEKNGVPNRPVAHELLKGDRDNIEVRWCSTHGEQCHSKLVIIKIDSVYYMTLGSANLTRRNISNLNLETNILVSSNYQVDAVVSAYDYINTVWENKNGRLYSEDYDVYGESSLYKTVLYRLMEGLGTSSF